MSISCEKQSIFCGKQLHFGSVLKYVYFYFIKLVRMTSLFVGVCSWKQKVKPLFFLVICSSAIFFSNSDVFSRLWKLFERFWRFRCILLSDVCSPIRDNFFFSLSSTVIHRIWRLIRLNELPEVFFFIFNLCEGLLVLLFWESFNVWLLMDFYLS